jgi:thiamine-monophosphate kinase
METTKKRGTKMKIKEIGGEFALIKRLAKKVNDSNVIKGIGDDCAVLKYNKKKYVLITTDMLVENDHFNLKWQTPFQVGMKLMEVNVSDIVSMGGTPKYAFVSLSLKEDTEVEFVEELYKGIYKSAKKHKVLVLGGDTTHGTEYVFNLTLIGETEKKLLRLRSSAKVNDLICVTGKLGGSTAGLKLLLNNRKGFLKKHNEPKSRTAKEGKTIAKYCNAMIDVSDGLGSEVRHICEESNVGAEVYYEKIPVSKETFFTAKKLKMNAFDFALYGGEDFELVFTVPEKKLKKLKREFSDFTVIGKILPKKEGVYLLKKEKKLPLKKGFDHFEN